MTHYAEKLFKQLDTDKDVEEAIAYLRLMEGILIRCKLDLIGIPATSTVEDMTDALAYLYSPQVKLLCKACGLDTELFVTMFIRETSLRVPKAPLPTSSYPHAS